MKQIKRKSGFHVMYPKDILRLCKNTTSSLKEIVMSQASQVNTLQRRLSELPISSLQCLLAANLPPSTIAG